MKLKLVRRARGHFVTLIEIRMHLIRVKPGHIYRLGLFLTSHQFFGLVKAVLTSLLNSRRTVS